MTRRPPSPPPESRYWVALCAAAILAGIWVYYRLSQSSLICLSDDCPRPGTFAHRQAVGEANSVALETAVLMTGGVLLAGLLVRAVMLFLRRRRK